MISRERVPRTQLDESHIGVPPESTTTDTNLLPRLKPHGRLAVETASTTKLARLPCPYRYWAERRVSTMAPRPQACGPDPGAGAVLTPGEVTDGCGLARGGGRRSTVSPARGCWRPLPALDAGWWPAA